MSVSTARFGVMDSAWFVNRPRWDEPRPERRLKRTHFRCQPSLLNGTGRPPASRQDQLEPQMLGGLCATVSAGDVPRQRPIALHRRSTDKLFACGRSKRTWPADGQRCLADECQRSASQHARLAGCAQPACCGGTVRRIELALQPGVGALAGGASGLARPHRGRVVTNQPNP